MAPIDPDELLREHVNRLIEFGVQADAIGLGAGRDKSWGHKYSTAKIKTAKLTTARNVYRWVRQLRDMANVILKEGEAVLADPPERGSPPAGRRPA